METIQLTKSALSHHQIADFILSQIQLDETEGTHIMEFSDTLNDTLACLDLEYYVSHKLSKGDHFTPDELTINTEILKCQVYYIDENDERVNLDIDLKKFKNQIA